MFLVSATLLVLITPTNCLSDPLLPDSFFDFGSDVGDTVAPPSDDQFSTLPLTASLPFCGNRVDKLYLSTDGFISFYEGIERYSSEDFPLSNSIGIVAVYWSDVSTLANNGRVYYRQTNDSSVLTKASNAVAKAFRPQGFYEFQARWAFVATWHNVTYYGGNSSTPTQSFQSVIVTDGATTFVIFNYGNMTWTHGANPGMHALVGYNCPDGRNYKTVPSSRTKDVVNIGSQTNVATTGRWMFRLDASNETACGAASGLTGAFPSHNCPILSGPTVINRLWIEFYCIVSPILADLRARFNVTFYSGNEIIHTDTATSANRNVTLHERYLKGHLGKWLYCAVSSYWNNTMDQRSPTVQSSNSYLPGIEVIGSPQTVTEIDPEPLQLVIKSTLPITCQQLGADGQPTNCQMTFDIFLTSSDIAVRQQNSNSTSKSCKYVLREEDWKPKEMKAYNSESPLQARAKIDLYVSSPRSTQITLKSPVLAMRSINGITYRNLWADYQETVAQVVHIDSESPLGNCTSIGDPHITTLDGLLYTTMKLGEFVYARSTFGLPFEVQAKHKQCPTMAWGNDTSCVCGVIMREDNYFLGIDMCDDGALIYVGANAKNLPAGAGITHSQNGRSVKIQMPSGGKIIATVDLWGIHMVVFVPQKIRTDGLCGSNDKNRNNDLKYRDNRTFASVQPDRRELEAFVESWSVPVRESLFHGHIIPLPRGDPAAETPSTFCTCAVGEDVVCGGFAVADNSSSAWEPNIPAIISERQQHSAGARRKRAPDDNPPQSQNLGEWPTPSNVTEVQAWDMCNSSIVTDRHLGPYCYSMLVSAEVTSNVVRKCVADFKITDDLQFSANSKVPELQWVCVNQLASTIRSDVTNTTVLISQVLSVLPNATSYMCEPFDCSGHGECVQGRCVCNKDFIGTDCAVPRFAIPAIVRLLDPAVCDVRTQRCEYVTMVTTDRTSNVSCKVDFFKLDGSNASYQTQGRVNSLTTTACSLPVELTSIRNNNSNFSVVYASGYEFSNLAFGGANLTYTLSISNDGRFYSTGLTLRLVDTLCVDCSDTTCTQKPATCLINGYCFREFDSSPVDTALMCLPGLSPTQWSSTGMNSTKLVVTTSLHAKSVTPSDRTTSATYQRNTTLRQYAHPTAGLTTIIPICVIFGLAAIVAVIVASIVGIKRCRHDDGSKSPDPDSNTAERVHSRRGHHDDLRPEEEIEIVPHYSDNIQ